jgi:anti-anti-sigma factor
VKISTQEFGPIAVVTLSGEYTADDVDAFNRVATERAKPSTMHVVIDCEHLEFIDSAGLQSFLRLQEKLGTRGGQLRLAKTDDTVQTILRLTRLELAFDRHDSIERAVRSLR